MTEQYVFAALASDDSVSAAVGRFRYVGSSWTGETRSSNQDSFGVVSIGENWIVASVADGMGGYAGGDIASSEAIETINASASVLFDKNPSNEIDGIVSKINSRLEIKMSDSPLLAGLGTTLSSIIISGSDATMLHIGDSRIYLCRSGVVRQLTRDHSWVQEQVDAGALSQEEADTHPKRNLITRALGPGHFSRVDSGSVEVLAGDRYLVCSDGVSGVVDLAQFERAINDEKPENAVTRLMDIIRANGSPDNATIVIVDVASNS